MNFIFDPTVTFGDLLALLLGFVIAPLFVHFKKKSIPPAGRIDVDHRHKK